MWPDDESVRITELAEGPMGSPVERHLLENLHEDGNDQRQWWTHSHTVSLSVGLASETEVWGLQDMAEEPQDILLKMLDLVDSCSP
jgi:hypothetical protein